MILVTVTRGRKRQDEWNVVQVADSRGPGAGWRDWWSDFSGFLPPPEEI